jgi:general secretion pathway protein F
MAAFEYQALNQDGHKTTGVLEGDSARHVRQRLKEQGLMPIELVEVKSQRAESTGIARRFQWRRGISATDLSLITRQLSTLVQAGMPLDECLKAVTEQSDKVRIRNVVTSVRAKVNEGYSFADSLADFPYIFDPLFQSMIAAGERSGHLEQVLSRLATYTENRQKMRSKLLQALIYPIVLVVVAISVVVFLLIAVVPKIIGQFLHTGQLLPTSTQFLLDSSEFVQHWGLLLFILFFVFTQLAKWMLKKPAVKLDCDRRMLKIPLLGKVIKGLNTARFARTLSICTSSSIPILDGMKVAADVVSNQYMKKRVLASAELVREGTSLRKSLSQTELFPPMMLHMIASGEQSGELESMLLRAADNQDEQFEATTNIALGLFTPLMIALMGGLVMFIVLATLMPILEMNNLMTR